MPADSYDRFMGVYSVQLAPQLADLAGVATGRRVLDVGCGPGALTTELVRRLGPDDVVAPLNREQACHYARGITVADVFRNFLGRGTGPTRGRDGRSPRAVAGGVPPAAR